MVVFLTLLLAGLLLPGLLRYEKMDHVPGKLQTKTPLSILFVILAVMQGGLESSFGHWMLVGFILCLFGDVLLIFPSRKSFLAGLVSFLAGHLFYLVAFTKILSPDAAPMLPALFFGGVSLVVFFWLRPHLGSMLLPVIGYIVVISAMMVGASLVLIDDAVPLQAGATIFLGALLFYLSDLFVARNRFVKKAHLNRQIGLPLYYSGQFILAYAVALV